MIEIKPAKRTESVKEYYFSVKNKEIAKINVERKARGLDPVVNLGIGSPDGTPPRSAIEVLCKNAPLDGVHGYQPYVGIPELREAFAKWYEKYYHVTLDPSSEIQPLTGSKEGILIASLTFLDKGDKVLVPDPGYPTYTSASLMVEADMIKYDLTEETGWMPDFDALEKMDLSGVKMMWTNYPGMPTGVKASRELYEKIVDFGLRHNILIINDNPYSFILNEEPLSILEIPRAKECCLEMNSLSKAHNMAGWRVGMIAGDASLIKEILKVKSQMDSGIFRPLQLAAVEALSQGDEWFSSLNKVYRERKEVVWQIFDLLGAKYDRNTAGLFVWGRITDRTMETLGLKREEGVIPAGEVSDKILYGCGVFITPGFIFGHNGENYIRASLCAPVEKLQSALEKVRTLVK